MKFTATAHPGRLLKRELTARGLSANRLALDIGVPSGRITDILKWPPLDYGRHSRAPRPLFRQ
jgi:plasmid maintenance system antidote protein VapI